MEGEHPVPGGGAEGWEGQASGADLGGRDVPGGLEDPRMGGRPETNAVARVQPQAAQALGGPVGDADAMPGPLAGIPRPEPLRFILLVPFRSPMQAEMARHLLAFSAQPRPEAGQQEVRVSGNHLAIRLTAEDMEQLRHSIFACLQELFVLIEVMQHIGPPFFFINPGTMNGG